MSAAHPQQRHGVETRVVRHRNGVVTVDDYAKFIDKRTRVLLVSSVQWINGLRMDLAAFSQLAQGAKRLGAHLHPEITMTGIAMHFMMDAYAQGDHATVRAFFQQDIGKLASAVNFFACPDNTAHIALETPGGDFAIPCLHIAEVVAEQARREGREKVGILGTNWTMTGPVYPGALGRRGIAWDILRSDRKIIHDIIFYELTLGIFKDSSRDAYVRIVQKLAHRPTPSLWSAPRFLC